MIKYIEGDLIKLATQYDVIAHCCNCFNTMGSGIAPQIAKAFPYAEAADNKTVKGQYRKLGKISIGHPTQMSSDPIVCNIYGQFGFNKRKEGGRDLSYVALADGLRAMVKVYTGLRFLLPQLGAGLAGGKWEFIEQLIEEIFEGEDVTVVIYKK